MPGPKSDRLAKRSGKTARASSRTAPISKLHRAPRPSSLSPGQLQKRADALAAHADMLRDPNLTASQAAKGRGVSTRGLLTYIPKAFKKGASGRIRAVPDRYVRRMEMPGPNGPELIKVKGSKARNELARYRNDVFRFQGGDLTALDKWDGVTIQGHKLLTDRQILQRLGEQDMNAGHGPTSTLLDDPDFHPLTYAHMMQEYIRHPEAKSLDPDGRPCTAETRGLLQRAHITAGTIRYIDKETSSMWAHSDDLSVVTDIDEVGFRVIEYGKNRKVQLPDSLKREIREAKLQRELRRRKIGQHTIENALQSHIRMSTYRKILAAIEEYRNTGPTRWPKQPLLARMTQGQ